MPSYRPRLIVPLGFLMRETKPSRDQFTAENDWLIR